MILEDQCASLELCKKLKSLGVKQESLFYYYRNHEINGCYDIDRFAQHWETHISAFTSAELASLLPNKIGEDYFTTHRCSRNGWWCFYQGINEEMYAHWSNKEADCRAILLIHLIENGLLDHKPQ